MPTPITSPTTKHVLPAKPSVQELLLGFLGGSIGIFGLLILSNWSHQIWLMAPFGASCVLLFAVPASPLAQPRNVIGGHLVSALIGLIFLYAFGSSPLSMALSVGTAIAAMQWLRVVHPPAGANPLVILTGAAITPDFILFPVLSGAIFLVTLATLLNNYGANKWPNYWLGSKSK